MIYFVFKRSLIFQIIQWHFSRFPLIWSSLSKTENDFLKYFGLYILTTGNTTIYKVTMTKVKFRF